MRPTILPVIVLICLLGGTLRAQLLFEWNHSPRTQSIGYCIAIDKDNVYFSGAGFAGQKTYIAKYASDGAPLDSIILQEQQGGNLIVQGIKVDSQENVYITGMFARSCYFDGTTLLSSNNTSDSDYDIFIVKYNSLGNLVWANRIGSSGNDVGYSLTLDEDNNIYVCGIYSETVDFDPSGATVNLTNGSAYGSAFLAKYNNAGGFIWVRNIASAVCKKVDHIGNDSLLLSGYFYTTTSFNFGSSPPATITSAGGADVFFARCTTAGGLTNIKTFGGPSTDQVTDFKYAAGDGLYITGNYGKSCDFNPGPEIDSLVYHGINDAYMAKYDPSGNYLFATSWGGVSNDYCNGVDVDQFKNIWVVGTFEADTIDFDPGPGVVEYGAGPGNQNGIIIKYDSLGNLLWSQPIAGRRDSSGLDDYLNDIFIHNNHLYITGGSNTGFDCDFSSDTAYFTDRTDFSLYGHLVAYTHYTPIPELVDELGSPLFISTYPNPAESEVVFTLPKNQQEPLFFAVYNMQGQLVMQQSGVSPGNAKINVSSLKNGLYNFTVSDRNGPVGYSRVLISK